MGEEDGAAGGRIKMDPLSKAFQERKQHESDQGALKVQDKNQARHFKPSAHVQGVRLHLPTDLFSKLV